MKAETAPVAPGAALHRELTQERIQSARRINVVRFWGVSAFFALFLFLGGVLELPAWTGNLRIFAVYWVITAVVVGLSRLPRVAPYTTLAVAFVDMPMVFFLQWATFPTSPSASGVAGFTVGVYVHRARLTTEREPVPLVMANEARLGQVFVNLLVNAAQAVPEGAVATNEIRQTTRTDERGRALVEVRDTGSGIAPEILGRLFDPFFTTKPVGEGTGLGLSICHGIVTALGGELTVESELRRGTTFRVALPAAVVDGHTARPVVPVGDHRALDPAAPVAPPAAGPTERRGRILVIHDDPHIGDAVRESLARERDVVAVTSAPAALRLIELGEPFDLILCNLMMPTMTGMDLHDERVRREPALAARMSFLTGGAFTPRARAFLAEVPNPRLEKPFDPQGLRSFVRALVGAPPTTTEVTS